MAYFLELLIFGNSMTLLSAIGACLIFLAAVLVYLKVKTSVK